MSLANNKVSLFGNYPRVLGNPVRIKIIYNLNELNQFVKQNISKMELHLSLYSFSTLVRDNDIVHPDYYSAYVDKIFLDVDEGDWLGSMRNLRYWCKDNDILHRFHLSSYKGGHFFIACKPNMQYKKTAVHNFQSYLIKKFNVEYDKGVSTLGDLARSFRIPNTFNFKRNCYCVPITDKELENLTLKELNDLNDNPRKKNDCNYWYGKKLVDLEPFDKEKFMFKLNHVVDVNINDLLIPKELEELNVPFDKFPPCIQYLVKKRDLNYGERYVLTLYLRDQRVIDLTDKEIVSVLKSVLTRERWIHCSTGNWFNGKPGENLLQIKSILEHLEWTFPSCGKYVKKYHQYCPRKCDRWHPIYK